MKMVIIIINNKEALIYLKRCAKYMRMHLAELQLQGA